MNRYGQAITWGAITAPHLFTGNCMSFTQDDQLTRQLDEDEAGDNQALILHSRKIAISFEAKIKEATSDFLDLSTGAAITYTGIGAGVCLANRAVEEWNLKTAKHCSIQAALYPAMVQASPAMAGATVNAFVPDQSGLTIVTPGATIIYGTYGLGHAAGVVHRVRLEQQITITEDEVSPAGDILGAASHAYLRTLQVDILAKAAAPAEGSVLVMTGGPTRMANYKIEKVSEKFAEKRGMMYGVEAIWIPPFA